MVSLGAFLITILLCCYSAYGFSACGVWLARLCGMASPWRRADGVRVRVWVRVRVGLRVRVPCGMAIPSWRMASP